MRAPEEREWRARLLGAYLAMEFGNLIGATRQCKMMCWGWNSRDMVSELEANRNGRADGWQLLKLTLYVECVGAGASFCGGDTPWPVLRGWLT